MELMIRNGDYVPDGLLGLRRVEGREALLQRVLFRLQARRGSFLFEERLGSRLWTLGRLPASARKSAARQYVAEALEEETDLAVEDVLLREEDGHAYLTAELSWRGEPLSVRLEVRT